MGTGGAPLREFGAWPRTASRAPPRHTASLKLTLGTGGYTWTFVPVRGTTYADAGSAACH